MAQRERNAAGQSIGTLSRTMEEPAECIGRHRATPDRKIAAPESTSENQEAIANYDPAWI